MQTTELRLLPARAPWPTHNVGHRDDIAGTLRGALDLLWDGVDSSEIAWSYSGSPREEYICHAVDRLNPYNKEEVKNLIGSRLVSGYKHFCLSFQTWWNINARERDRESLKSGPELQALRKAWLLDLIEEFES